MCEGLLYFFSSCVEVVKKVCAAGAGVCFINLPEGVVASRPFGEDNAIERTVLFVGFKKVGHIFLASSVVMSLKSSCCVYLVSSVC